RHVHLPQLLLGLVPNGQRLRGQVQPHLRHQRYGDQLGIGAHEVGGKHAAPHQSRARRTRGAGVEQREQTPARKPMTTAAADLGEGNITTERLGRVFAIGIDRSKKLNGFSPKMLIALAEAMTAFERDEEAWVALLFAHGGNFTAGLELDKVAPYMR